MRRLLWKELREKWVWLLALTASSSGLVILHDPYTFLGGPRTPWIVLSALSALGLGASAYSTELAGGAADFARSRPISWKKMLLAKFAVGLAFVVIAAILATIVFRLNCPAQYIRFVGPSELARGCGVAVLLTGSLYIAGFACSTVLPGAIGGMLVGIGVVLSCFLEMYIWDRYRAAPSAYWSMYLRVVGAMLATVLIARFGLTLPASRRLFRYASIVAVFAIVGVPLNYHLKADPFAPGGSSSIWDLSPNGKYAALEQTTGSPGSAGYRYASFLVRVSDGKRANASWPQEAVGRSSDWSYWHEDTFVAISSHANAPTSAPTYLWMGRMDHSGRLRSASVPVTRHKDYNVEIVPSPSGRRVMVAATVDERWTNGLTFADLDTLQELAPKVKGGVNGYWWQSETEVGYTDKDGNRHSIRLVE